MTEEDAKTKWCPMVRFHNGMDGDVYCSRPTGTASYDSAKCIASDCMMWVWDETLDTDNDGNPTGGTNYDTEGHCGLTKEG